MAWGRLTAVGVAAVLAASAVGGPGCAGGRSLDTWAKQATATCGPRNDVLKAASRPTTLKGVGEVATSVARAVEDWRHRLAAVTPPSGKADRQTAMAVSSAGATVAADLHAVAAVVGGDDYAPMDAAVAKVDADAKAMDGKANAAKAPTCGLSALLYDPVLRAGTSDVRDAFIAAADARCAVDTRAFHDKVVASASQSDFVSAATELVDGLIKDVTGLKPPGRERNALDDYVHALQAIDDSIKQMAGAPAGQQAQTQAAVEKQIADIEAKGSAYGFHACSLIGG
jgi:hypothetical protein